MCDVTYSGNTTDIIVALNLKKIKTFWCGGVVVVDLY